MEIILELILEIILEGIKEGVTSKKVPLPVRILLAGLLILMTVGILGLITFAAVKTKSVLLFLLDFLLAFLFAYGLIKTLKNRKNRS